jgi:hypothetical protein
MTRRATWNGAIIAESDQTVLVEGNHYFPPDVCQCSPFCRNLLLDVFRRNFSVCQITVLRANLPYPWPEIDTLKRSFT